MEKFKTFFTNNKKVFGKGLLIAAGVVGAIFAIGAATRKEDLEEDELLLEEDETATEETPEE